MPYSKNKTKRKSRLAQKIENKYKEKFKEEKTIGEIMDKFSKYKDGYFRPYSMDKMKEIVEDELDIKIPRSTFAKMIKIETFKAEKGLSKMHYRLIAKRKNNPYRDHSKWSKNRKRNKKIKTKKLKKRYLFHCTNCNETTLQNIEQTENGYYGLASQDCPKCESIGKGYYEFKDGDKTKFIYLEEDDEIKGLFKEITSDKRPK